MEGRKVRYWSLFSRATNIVGLAPIRLKKLSRDCLNVSFVSAKPIGAVGDGRNVMWGRQLRSSLLVLESSPIIKREILKSVLASASFAVDGGSDSAGDAEIAPVRFLQKYPAFVTGFFFFMWFGWKRVFSNQALEVVHGKAVLSGVDSDFLVSSALVDMGYAQNGQDLEALSLYENLLQKKLKPDDVTFVAVLSACSHAGLVQEGR
ncbi:chlorophyll a-b binding protein 40 [Hibiscus syriacus]|uniref:Chlorophyll a-b binding protein 40 n=1 Tax=Hibiscus syriacus TaxID=106335 RepID=A0A6A3D842_HIBSY|nr:chlorophyll a-b binding protein 40 [Hibiscus syriacus]